jgi:3-deoxy-D-manno-octulosonate 8-phosphate phosphatase (KDO 8-P phosphatase)
MGISLARKSGLLVALISGEDSPLVDRFAEKMRITDVYKGCKDKAEALRALAERYHFSLAEICFMGDDVNDVPAMEIAGLAAAPADAQQVAVAKAGWLATHAGGNGAVRQLVDLLLSGSV